MSLAPKTAQAYEESGWFALHHKNLINHCKNHQSSQALQLSTLAEREPGESNAASTRQRAAKEVFKLLPLLGNCFPTEV